MKKIVIILLLLLIASPLYAEIIDNGDSTITDTITGLMWRKYDNGSNVTYADAVIYTENLNYGKYTNWRIPSIDELKTMISHRNLYGVGSISSNVDSYSGSHYCYFYGLPELSGTFFCNVGNVYPVRNPQYDIDKIYTQAQMDDALNSATQQERARWDANGDNKIGLEEAIRALQIVSGAMLP